MRKLFSLTAACAAIALAGTAFCSTAHAQWGTLKGQLVLDGALTMRTVETVRATLRAAIEPPSGATPAGPAPAGSSPAGISPAGISPAGIVPAGIEIDCSATTEIYLTFIQLLIAARVSSCAAGCSLSLAPRPDGVLLDTLTRGGFRLVPEPGGGFWFTGEAT